MKGKNQVNTTENCATIIQLKIKRSQVISHECYYTTLEGNILGDYCLIK